MSLRVGADRDPPYYVTKKRLKSDANFMTIQSTQSLAPIGVSLLPQINVSSQKEGDSRETHAKRPEGFFTLSLLFAKPSGRCIKRPVLLR
jgi:hypothetical protein